MAPELAPSWRLSCCRGYSCAVTATGKTKGAFGSFSSQGLKRSRKTRGPGRREERLWPQNRPLSLLLVQPVGRRHTSTWCVAAAAAGRGDDGGGQQNGLCRHLGSPAAGVINRVFQPQQDRQLLGAWRAPCACPFPCCCAGSCAHQDREEGFSGHHREVLQPPHS
jgi:hypothetical protein